MLQSCRVDQIVSQSFPPGLILRSLGSSEKQLQRLDLVVLVIVRNKESESGVETVTVELTRREVPFAMSE